MGAVPKVCVFQGFGEFFGLKRLEACKPGVLRAVIPLVVLPALGGLDVRQATTQRAQYPLIKEYSLKHNMKPYII